MKKILGVLAGVAVFVGVLALATPTPVVAAKWPDCSRGKYCGTPEPDFYCPTCYYWEPCGPQCGCKLIPGCTHPAGIAASERATP
jgi:hypothetical protein